MRKPARKRQEKKKENSRPILEGSTAKSGLYEENAEGIWNSRLGQ